jgi:hypothetical protein
MERTKLFIYLVILVLLVYLVVKYWKTGRKS